MTPKRPDAICLTALFALSPLARGCTRSAPSPPSPDTALAPMRFMAMASVSCASGESAPSDMPGVTKRRRMAVTGSTSSSGTATAAVLKASRSRSATGGSAWTPRENR